MSDLKRLRISTFAARRNAGNPISRATCYVIWKSCFIPFLRKSSTVMESIRKNLTSCTIQNSPVRTGAGSDNYKSQKRNSATQTVKKDHNSQNKSKAKPAHEHNRVNVAVIGDSMVKHLNPSKLRKGTKHNINVQTFSEANVADMRYFVKPAISRSPDYLLLHVGTNDLKRQTPQQIAGSISTMCREIAKDSPDTKVVLSEVITRSDDSSLNPKIKELNCKLSQVCQNNNWGLLNHNNITADYLNTYGLRSLK